MPRSTSHIQDELLVIRCQQGEPSALEALIRRWTPPLHRHAWSLTRDTEAARDAVQEAWIAMARGIRGLDDPACFAAWAYRIVGRRCADWVRTTQRRRRLLRRAAETVRGREAAAIPASDGLRELLQQALRELDPDRHAVLTMHYVERMSVNHIAAALDIPIGTVKSRLHNARHVLRQAIERMNP